MRSSIINSLIIIGLIVVTLVITFASSLLRPQPTATLSATTEQSEILLPAPDITIKDLNDRDVKLHDFKGRVVLLNFWASWCGPCVGEFKQFMKLAQMMPDNVTVLAVSIDVDRGNLDRFLARYGKGHENIKNLTILRDPDKSISQDIFGTIKLPETIIITPDLKMAGKVAGLPPYPWNSTQMQQRLEQIAAPHR